ncbi:hypothetical protein [Pararhodonellum marinum]|uniref:hypothetical protein n=1 Tax=Pararhodonellum marinum TaxID=2755358 RepID=UPI0018902884|nr:hypothetical protein [Pararhodonellum marinum]
MKNIKNSTLTNLKSYLKIEVLQAIDKALHHPNELLASPMESKPERLNTDSRKASIAGAFVALFILDPLGIQASHWAVMEKEFDEHELQELCEVLGQNLSSPI